MLPRRPAVIAAMTRTRSVMRTTATIITITATTTTIGGAIIVTRSSWSTGAGGVGGMAGGIRPGVTMQLTRTTSSTDPSTITAGFLPTRSLPMCKPNCKSSVTSPIRPMGSWDHSPKTPSCDISATVDCRSPARLIRRRPAPSGWLVRLSLIGRLRPGAVACSGNHATM